MIKTCRTFSAKGWMTYRADKLLNKLYTILIPNYSARNVSA